MDNAGGKRGSLFLGLDASTQGLKAVAIDAKLSVCHECTVNFDRDLPEYGTEGGAHRAADGLTVTAPAIMWVAALDWLLDRMKADGFPFDQVDAVSGSGQQHGSVWLKATAGRALMSMVPTRSLRDQMADQFTLADSPIWMDSSTGRQCREREAALGGPQAVADLTGSRAYERFTGNQIAKIYQVRPDVYGATDRIALVSSFMASLLAGRHAPIDASDGSGMNLMNIRTRRWDARALDCTAPALEAKLGSVVASHAVVGPVSDCLASRYGFRRDALVVAFSGDNPNSLAGLRLQREGDLAISLGTSDTEFGFLAEPAPSATEGHVFANPVDPNAYMAMICYKNGSLTRERVRDEGAGGSWEAFGQALGRTPAGNGGRIGFYIHEPEITPPILRTGVRRFDANGEAVGRFAPPEEIRAVVESQFLSMRLHGANLGLKPRSILATGGASANRAMIRVMADVFGAPVWVGDQPNSASLGAAYRALHGWTCDRADAFVPFADVLGSAPRFEKAAEPDIAAHRVYSGLLDRYRQLEEKVVADGN